MKNRIPTFESFEDDKLSLGFGAQNLTKTSLSLNSLGNIFALRRHKFMKIPRCKWFEYKDIKVQGKSELKWAKENYSKIKIQKRTHIKTPYGIYIPDFETDDAYIEVKSSWTFQKLFEKDEYKLKKMQYVNDNIKKVIIYIDEGNEWIIKNTKF